MSQYFQIHPANPQLRLINRAVAIVRSGGVIVYPTDSCYALGCHIGDKAAMDRIRLIRQVGNDHNFTLVCRDLTELGIYAKIENRDYRLIKSHTPGPYTFILKATREVPRRLQNPKRKTIGVRLPIHAVTRVLLEALGEPLMSSTLLFPDEDIPTSDPEEMLGKLNGRVDLVIDGGFCGHEPTTVIDLTHDLPIVVRRGLGDSTHFERVNAH